MFQPPFGIPPYRWNTGAGAFAEDIDTLAEVLAQGNNANALRIENLGAPNSSDDAIRFNSIIRGSVLSNATIVAGTGFTVVQNGVGLYTVTITTPFASAPLVIGTVISISGARIWTVDTIAADSFHVIITDSGGGVSNNDWNFLAMLYI